MPARILSVVFVVALAVAASPAGFGQDPAAPKPVGPAPKPPQEVPPDPAGARAVATAPSQPAVPRDLDGMLAFAMRSNPDVLLAEAKLRQAEAELHQARLKVAQEVMELRGDRERIEQRLHVTVEDYERIRKLVATGNVPTSEASKGESEILEAKAALNQLEAKARYLCGIGPSGVAGGSPGGGATRSRSDSGSGDAQGAIATAPVPSLVAEKLQQLTDARAELMRFKEVLGLVRRMTGLLLVIDPSAENVEELVTIELSAPISWRAWLQAVGDQTGTTFVVREYGLLVTGKGSTAANETPPPSPPRGR